MSFIWNCSAVTTTSGVDYYHLNCCMINLNDGDIEEEHITMATHSFFRKFWYISSRNAAMLWTHVTHTSACNYLGTILPNLRHVWVVKSMQLCKWMKYAWLQIISLIKESNINGAWPSGDIALAAQERKCFHTFLVQIPSVRKTKRCLKSSRNNRSELIDTSSTNKVILSFNGFQPLFHTFNKLRGFYLPQVTKARVAVFHSFHNRGLKAKIFVTIQA
jgi:hypothetical protein